MINIKRLNNNIYSDLINDTNKKIINDINVQIQIANKNNLNNILYELPYYFENLLEIIEKNTITIDKLRIIIWGNIIECLIDNGFEITIDNQKKEEKCYIFIKWPTSLDKFINQINKYSKLIEKHSYN